VVQAADAAKGDDLSGAGRFDGARDRRIAAERHVRSVPVVVVDVLADQAEQMPLAEHDDVVEQFAPQRPDPPLGESVLHGERAAIRICPTPRFSTRASNVRPEDRIPVSYQTQGDDIRAETASTICWAAQARRTGAPSR
jgi:hypothetical protein